MEAIIHYLIVATVCIVITYSAYLLLFRNDRNFKLRRLFLVFAATTSFLMPFSNYGIQIGNSQQTITTYTSNLVSQLPQAAPSLPANQEPRAINKTQTPETSLSAAHIFLFVYALILFVLLLKTLIGIFSIVACYKKSEKVRHEAYTIVYNTKFKNSFSFLNWIFIHKELTETDNTDTIIAHESVHVSQYHSFDTILFELLTIAMWFNPLAWKMKKSAQLVHEYLADEGVLLNGTSKVAYQSMLLNQIAEAKMISFTSDFNHSRISKRVKMMNNTTGKKSLFRILFLIPLSAVLFFSVACMNGESKSSSIAAIEISDIYPLYTNIDNKVKIAVSGYNNAELNISIDNGSIKEDEGEYIIKVDEPGYAIVTVSHDGREVQKIKYPVKVPDESYANMRNGKEYKVTPETWMNDMNITENEYMQLVYWVTDSLAYENDKIPISKNILYVGIDNIIAIPAAKYNKEIQVSISSGLIYKKDEYYVVRVTKPGSTSITVHIAGEQPQKKEFVVVQPEFFD